MLISSSLAVTHSRSVNLVVVAVVESPSCVPVLLVNVAVPDGVAQGLEDDSVPIVNPMSIMPGSGRLCAAFGLPGPLIDAVVAASLVWGD
jgi:hypothetical protein